MAAATTDQRAGSNESTLTTSHTVNLAGSASSGNLLLVQFYISGGSPAGTITWPSGGGAFTEFFTGTNGNNKLAWAYRQADGTEGSTITVTTSTSHKSAHRAFRITGHEIPATQAPESATAATGSSTTPDPGSLSPTGGSKDYLWIAGTAQAADDATAGPTSYTDLNTARASSSVTCATAERTLTAASEDPGAFTIPTGAWIATVVAVHPAGAFTTAVISEGVGTDDENVPVSLDTHDDANTDHSDLHRSTVAVFTPDSTTLIQNNITPSQGDVIIDNVGASTTAPPADTALFYILRDFEDSGETVIHDSNITSAKTAPARPTGIQVS